ncbi:MAG TPA: transcription termination/antitermination protein NusA [Lachnospiraceae bacterium]|nr:transcription termination/antitermination protein NusA [Lachnospiraceae bacterium]
MNTELLDALNVLEKEKNISKDSLLDAIEQSLLQACKNHFGTSNNVEVNIDRETCNYSIFIKKEVVEEVFDPAIEITLEDAHKYDASYVLGDFVNVPVESKAFGRIATQNAKNIILQKIREEERRVLYDEYIQKEHDMVTGVVQRYMGQNVSINLGKMDALLTKDEMIEGEKLHPNDRIKVYVVEVRNNPRGPRITVSRTHPELVKRLFEEVVTEVHDGIIDIKGIAREAGSRTKMSVYSKDPDVDAVGACVGLNGVRVNSIVNELHGEKIDIINWNENPAILIENALSPAKVISVLADPDEEEATVIVPDYQLSLAIGKEGQNARLAARLTGYKIDIKSETQAREDGDFDFDEYDEDEYDDEYEYEEEYEDAAKDEHDEPEADEADHDDSGADAGEEEELSEEEPGEESAAEQIEG